MTIAVFFEFLLISKKNKSGPDKILALWMFLITAHLFLFYMSYTGEMYNYPTLLGVGIPFPLFHGVFLYLYVASVTNQLPAQRNFLFLHFVPVVVMYLYLITFFVLPADEKILIFKNRGAGHEVFNAIGTVAVVLSGICYVIWTTLLLRKHRRRILDQFSYQDKIDLQWLQILIWGIGGIWLLLVFRNDTIVFSGVSLFVFLIGFFGIRQVRIFAPGEQNSPLDEPKKEITGRTLTETVNPGQELDEPKTPGIDTAEKEKYAKSGLSKDQAEQLYLSVTRLMKEESLYKKNDLTLDDLATRLKVHSNYLSQVINEKDGKNFYDFVNYYRLEEFKRLLSIPKNRNLTLLSLAFDCGFNSKSSFNRHFKKVTGQTPSEYFSSLTPQ